MVRGLERPCYAEVVSVSGANVETITNLVEGYTVMGQVNFDVAPFKYIVIHVGTNNIRKQSNVEIQNNFVYLLRAIRTKCTNPHIFLSCILPRTKDHAFSGPQVRAVNRWLRRWSKDQGIQCIDAAPLFTDDRGRIKDYLYKRDDLHLSKAGLSKLRDKFRQVMTMDRLGHT